MQRGGGAAICRQEQFVQQIRDFFAAMDQDMLISVQGTLILLVSGQQLLKQDDSGDVTPEELAAGPLDQHMNSDRCPRDLSFHFLSLSLSLTFSLSLSLSLRF